MARIARRSAHGEVPGCARTGAAGGIGITLAEHIGAAGVFVLGNPDRHRLRARDHGAGEVAGHEHVVMTSSAAAAPVQATAVDGEARPGGQREGRETIDPQLDPGAGGGRHARRIARRPMPSRERDRQGGGLTRRRRRTRSRTARRRIFCDHDKRSTPRPGTGLAGELGRSSARPLFRARRRRRAGTAIAIKRHNMRDAADLADLAEPLSGERGGRGSESADWAGTAPRSSIGFARSVTPYDLARWPVARR